MEMPQKYICTHVYTHICVCMCLYILASSITNICSILKFKIKNDPQKNTYEVRQKGRLCTTDVCIKIIFRTSLLQ